VRILSGEEEVNLGGVEHMILGFCLQSSGVVMVWSLEFRYSGVFCWLRH
jgi:hypothetical protein